METKAIRRQSVGFVVAVAVFALGSVVGLGGEPVLLTIELANTADPALFGAPLYEFSAVVFMKNATSVSIRSYYPFLVVAPGQTRELGPFELQENPDSLILIGRKGPPGPTLESLAVTITSLSSGIVHEEGTLRVMIRIGDERSQEETILTGYVLAVRQFWCSRSEGPLYLLQTGEFGLGLEGFYILVGEPRWPWLEDPLLQPLIGANVRVRGRIIPAGEDVPISADRSVTYPLPALIVEAISEVEPYERCGF